MLEMKEKEEIQKRLEAQKKGKDDKSLLKQKGVPT